MIMDLNMNGGFFTALVSIILINLMLSGDNAVVIAMAVRSLPPSRRRWGFVLGTTGAVFVRVICTLIVAKLLTIQYVKLAGGVIILWIAVKLLSDVEKGADQRPAGSLWQVIGFIIVADISMGVDNMLAVGGASHGNWALILFGLCFSIPLIIFSSYWLAKLMDQQPLIVIIGAALLGKIGGEMIMTDPIFHNHFTVHGGLYYGLLFLSAVTVVATGKYLQAIQTRK